MKRKEREDFDEKSPKCIHTIKETQKLLPFLLQRLSLADSARKAERSKCAARTQRALHFLLNDAFFIPIKVVIIIISIIIKNIISV